MVGSTVRLCHLRGLAVVAASAQWLSRPRRGSYCGLGHLGLSLASVRAISTPR